MVVPLIPSETGWAQLKSGGGHQKFFSALCRNNYYHHCAPPLLKSLRRLWTQCYQLSGFDSITFCTVTSDTFETQNGRIIHSITDTTTTLVLSTKAALTVSHFVWHGTRFYVPLDTKQVISEMNFPANLLDRYWKRPNPIKLNNNTRPKWSELTQKHTKI